MNNQDEAVAVAFELMKANRTTDMQKNMINQFRSMIPEIPDSFWDTVDASVLVDRLVPVYVKHLTIEDMKAAIAFFQSTAGQKILDKTPAITVESMKIGEQLGKELIQQWEKKHDVE